MRGTYQPVSLPATRPPTSPPAHLPNLPYLANSISSSAFCVWSRFSA
jgi:hypothetical protein